MVQVRAVLKEIGQDEESRVMVMARFKSSGGGLDRWHRKDREAMADAITRAEDVLELLPAGARRFETRMRLRAIRRRLEDDLDVA